ncbi:MAG TPA: hypothetical protein VHZ76_02825 [Gammaproteobacteria bacterium]|nr:hypothetical protein [Gammaproteobacteria bacterium]
MCRYSYLSGSRPIKRPPKTQKELEESGYYRATKQAIAQLDWDPTFGEKAIAARNRAMGKK